MPLNTHIGLTALESERKKLLRHYDTAKEQMADDPVKTEHGVVCESLFRAFLEQFLPKKYGVTKGYIITPDLNYAGPLEEWDIIVYDSMESPVLFVREDGDTQESDGKRGIPVEYVKAVIEVKATFNKASSKKATEKLMKLREFLRKYGSEENKPALPNTFSAFAVFFETKVKNEKEYRDALGEMSIMWQKDPLVQYQGGLIIRGQSCPDLSASISYMLSGGQVNVENMLVPYCEASNPVDSFVDDMSISVFSAGYGTDVFWRFMIDMVHSLNGNDSEYNPPNSLTGGYGVRSGVHDRKRLFQRAEPA